MIPVVRMGDMMMGMLYGCKKKRKFKNMTMGIVILGASIATDDAIAPGKMGITMAANIICLKCPMSIGIMGSSMSTVEGPGIVRMTDLIIGMTPGGIGMYISSSPDTVSG